MTVGDSDGDDVYDDGGGDGDGGGDPVAWCLPQTRVVYTAAVRVHHVLTEVQACAISLDKREAQSYAVQEKSRIETTEALFAGFHRQYLWQPPGWNNNNKNIRGCN